MKAVIQSAFKRQVQANGGRFNTGNILHGSKALLQEPLEGLRIAVAGIIERSLRGHYVGGVKAGRQGLQVDQAWIRVSAGEQTT